MSVVPLCSLRVAVALFACALPACDGGDSPATKGDAVHGKGAAGASQGQAAAGTVGGSSVDGPPATGSGDAPPVDRAAFERARNAAFRMLDAGEAPELVADALTAARELDPTAYGVNLRLGAIDVELKRYAEALVCYEAALAARPADPTAARETAWLSTELGDPERALVVLEAVDLGAENAGDALYLRGLALEQLGRTDEAFGLLGELPAEGAESARALRGRLHLQDGRLDEARRDFSAVLTTRPDDQAAIRGLADVARRSGDGEGAARWDEALSLLVALRDNRFARPTDNKADRVLQRLAARRSDYIAAEVSAHEQRLRRLIELLPDWTEGYELLAAHLRRDERLDEACAVIEELLTRHGERYDAERSAQMRDRNCSGATEAGG